MVFAMHPIFYGSCVLKSLSLKDNPIIWVLQVALKIKRAKAGGHESNRKLKTAKSGVDTTKTGKPDAS